MVAIIARICAHCGAALGQYPFSFRDTDNNVNRYVCNATEWRAYVRNRNNLKRQCEELRA